MGLTTEQRERLVGMVLMGTSSDTACDVLGVSASEVLATEDSDNVFAIAIHMARLCAVEFQREMEREEDAD
jgi:hypothetical protein